MDSNTAVSRVLPSVSDTRRRAEEREWRTDSPSPDPVGDVLDEINVPTDAHDYVILTAKEDGHAINFIGDDTRRIPVERSSVSGAIRDVAARRYGIEAVHRRPFTPAADVPEEYERAVRLFNPDLQELDRTYQDEVAEYGGGLQRTYLID
ncbi:MAG: hypothetical protein SVW77_02980 [Candidatus Nanohaloarchaea archaeon]|nr:hypothetical protein [Candidatus Nanohaloarchaea archaeon]